MRPVLSAVKPVTEAKHDKVREKSDPCKVRENMQLVPSVQKYITGAKRR